MYFYKIKHPYNFVSWNQKAPAARIITKDLGSDVFHVQIDDERRWKQGGIPSLITEDASIFSETSEFSVSCDADGSLSVFSEDTRLLEAYGEKPFGVLKDSWVWCFSLAEQVNFYGMGEKNVGFEKSGLRTKFWNTDAWADFGDDDINNGITDPMYASFPVLILRMQDHWAALIVPTASPVFMDTGARQVIEGVADTGIDDQFFYLGATGVAPELYIAVDTDPIELTKKIQRLCGVTPRPPLWSLGYHQSRWGYSTCDHLYGLDNHFRDAQIPCDGLWIDIDYMDGYRVFSLSDEVSENLEEHLERLKNLGRRVVPILDPGVKADPDYGPCKEGLAEDIFCKTAEGEPFTGFVWPGASYFPDFSLKKGKQWWAARTAELSKKGFDGYWIDMNDPSTGSVEPHGMLFQDGNEPHTAYHNAYGLGMAEATHQGILATHEDQRPFVLTRSGTIGSSKYGAMWTGDNISNYHHLRKGLEMVLSLSISGMPFVGSDVGGFGWDAYKKNYIDWFKTTYLLPFMRNHSADGTRVQEPWTFDEETLKITGTCIRARYALLPYLYQQFIAQEKEGTPILRPMIYQYPNDERFTDNASQFMIGDDLMQAPNLWEESFEGERTILIPEGRWIDLYDGTWVTGPGEYSLNETKESLHLFARAGAIIPIVDDLTQINSSNDIDLGEVSFLIIADTEGSYRYYHDDGLSYAYQNGGEKELSVSYKVSDGILAVESSEEALKLFVIGDAETVTVNGQKKGLTRTTVPIDGMGGEARSL